ncbi:endonuclease domain-containing protein [Brevundimonas sp. Leaf363]|uniref:endonuclease domain-containing protein n=1 Tax=Brevundimonas sp. Leaf363 TaxID=1736353 RepID=UPI000A73E8F4|nr:endonuclease domain-containing protein [Brevundimonas sp. Leaf363]
MPDAVTQSRASSLRKRMTPPEARLWTCLKGRAVGGLKFRRQHPVGSYILDFYCAEVKLAVEIDGSGHQHPDQATMMITETHG